MGGPGSGRKKGSGGKNRTTIAGARVNKLAARSSLVSKQSSKGKASKETLKNINKKFESARKLVKTKQVKSGQFRAK